MTSSPKAVAQDLRGRKKKKNLHILNINFYSIKKKGKSLKALIDASDPDIIVGTETWLNDQVSSAEIFPNISQPSRVGRPRV